MGVYLRKSVRVGPFRFNLSKSGVGISAGIKGFRIGTGPRGNYVHMGVGGIYYRATIPSAHPSSPQQRAARPIPQQVPASPSIDPTLGAMIEIASADASQIVDSSSRALIDELNAKHKKWRFWPGSAALFLALIAYGFANDWATWAQVLLLVAGSTATAFLYVKDDLRKSTVLMYDLDSQMETAYTRLHEAANALATCARTWHIQSSAKVYDSKYHAGAGAVVKRLNATIRKASPPFLKTNVETYTIGLGKRSLHFLPDRLFIYDGSGIGAINYRDLDINIRAAKFIETSGVPSDAQVVERTWQYVNKKGGPDKRFKNNREIPVCLYEEVEFSSATGINELLQLSRTGGGQELRAAVSEMGMKTLSAT